MAEKKIREVRVGLVQARGKKPEACIRVGTSELKVSPEELLSVARAALYYLEKFAPEVNDGYWEYGIARPLGLERWSTPVFPESTLPGAQYGLQQIIHAYPEAEVVRRRAQGVWERLEGKGTLQ